MKNELKLTISKLKSEKIDHYIKKNQLEVDSNDIESLLSLIYEDYNENRYNFSQFEELVRYNKKKKRIIYKFENFSEYVLSHHIKNILNKKYKVDFPNRENIMDKFFGIIPLLYNMRDFTIVKFDFKNFFNTIPTTLILNPNITSSFLRRSEKNLIEKYINQCSYCYAGLPASNSFAEIIASQFDIIVKEKLANTGLIFYSRYVDDGILIFNRYHTAKAIKGIIVQSIEQLYIDAKIDPHATNIIIQLNKRKFSHFSLRCLSMNREKSFNYLGYEISIEKLSNKKINIKYGISSNKIKKYTNKIVKFLKHWKIMSSNNFSNTILKNTIKAFTHRIVYQKDGGNNSLWINKGFIVTYRHLRNYIDSLDNNTNNFLENVILKQLMSLNIQPIEFAKRKTDTNNYYCLKDALKKNKTLIFVPHSHLGISYKDLKVMCQKMGITDLEYLRYKELLENYLNYVQVNY